MRERTGRVTIPTNLDIVPETIELMKRWGADAIRDCDGTEFPRELVETGAKIYATYYTTRKDNEWAKKNPDEVQLQTVDRKKTGIWLCTASSAVLVIPVFLTDIICPAQVCHKPPPSVFFRSLLRFLHRKTDLPARA